MEKEFNFGKIVPNPIKIPSLMPKKFVFEKNAGSDIQRKYPTGN